MATKIEWADLTINPTRGCQHCSPGCDNCYAERFAARLALNPQSGKSYAGLVDFKGKWTGRISDYDLSVFDRLPKTPKRIFVGSMTDLFFCGVNDTPRQALTTVEGTTYEFAPDIMHARLAMILIELGKLPQHTFMFLTKRAKAMREVMPLMLNHPLPNLWLGVTVCNRDELWKLDVLRETPAALRYVSFEPLLSDLGAVDLSGIGWVICGGETGPGARPMHPDWVRGLRDQCKAAEVPFFFKSWGEWLPCSDCPDDLDFEKHASGFIGDDGIFDAGNDGAFQCRNGVRDEQTFRVGKKRAGRLLDGQEHNEIPEGK